MIDISPEAVEQMAQACVQSESLASRFDFKLAATLRAQAKHIAELETAITNVLSGDYPVEIQDYWREDKAYSKHDKCKHGQWRYDDCGSCVDEYLQAILTTPPEKETP